VVVTFIPINKDGTASDRSYKIPLEPNQDSKITTINDSTITDGTAPETLEIHYQKEAVLISHQCGSTYKYTLKKITSTFSGKYRIINKELSILNDSEIDVQIYF
jgi:hypothetical protein